MFHIILEHVTWKFRIYYLFKFRKSLSHSIFREICEKVLEIAKFRYFAKQIIYSESQDRMLQSDI